LYAKLWAFTKIAATVGVLAAIAKIIRGAVVAEY
jgi:hypothetical protein